MSIWIEKSIEVANKSNYLDRLFEVYPLSPDPIRAISQTRWERVEKSFEDKNDRQLVNELLDLELFPIKDSYVSFLRKSRGAISANPNTVSRIAKSLYEMGLEDIWDRATAPKETNRQIGPLFRRWLQMNSLGVAMIESETHFLNSKENCMLNLGDAALKVFAEVHLGYNLDKGLDLVCKFNGKYVLGEAKFLTDFGGHQNAQLEDAMRLANHTSTRYITVAILDGVLYLPGRNKMSRIVNNAQDCNIVSSLLLREFLDQI